MRNLVIAPTGEGTWLADHLGATLLNHSIAGDMLVAKVDEFEDIYDRIYLLRTDLTQNTLTTIYGYSELGRKLELNFAFAKEQLESCKLLFKPADLQGISCGVLGWWEQGEWVGKPCLIVEQMGMMNRDLGLQLTHPQGVALIPIAWESQLAASSLRLLEPLLNDYHGPVGMRLTVIGKHIYVRYVKLGFVDGWLETALELQRDRLDQVPLNLTDNVAVGVHVSVPPYPYAVVDPEVRALKAELGAQKHFRYHDCYRLGTTTQVAGITGRVGYATAWGRPGEKDAIAQEARMRIYRSLRGVQLEGMQYRTDVSMTMYGVVDQLKALQLVG